MKVFDFDQVLQKLAPGVDQRQTRPLNFVTFDGSTTWRMAIVRQNY